MAVQNRARLFNVSRALLICCAVVAGTSASWAQGPLEKLFQDFRWRNLGPANFAGRIVDVEALDSDFRHVVVASASGGVWKSVNAGTTWEPVFDHYGSASIGDIAIFQKDPRILWVGTGEANNRNSVAWGDGIYKSTDGGKTFTHMGLKDTFQIARVITHPSDPDTVYVAAIGNLWGYTGDRGLFKTTDGGKSWAKLSNGLPDDGKTGAIDLVMDPRRPKTLYAAFYQRLRKPYRFDGGGPNGGIFKTTNGGRSWTKLTRGLPEGDTGRIGLAVHRGNPKILMAIVEHGFQPAEDDPDYYDMSKPGTGIYRSEDGGKTWQFLNRYNNRPFYYSQIRINPVDDQRVYVLSTTIRVSEDGGRTFRPGGLNFEGGLDYHALWIDPSNGSRYYLGKDKGLTLTHDHGQTFILFDNMPVGQFYAIGVDMRDPYYVYGGTQDNGTWGGPSFSRDARGIFADSWWKLHWGDGMFIQVDPTDWRKVYTEAENGSFRRYDAETRRVESTRPRPENTLNYSDYVEEGAEINQRRGLPGQFRFNWRSPLLLSPHNPQTLYLGGNHLFRSVDGGYQWQIISPDLSTNDPEKVDRESGGLTRDVTGAEEHGAITALAESPLTPGLLWAGTDDGNLQLTRDGGVTWTNLRANIPDVPEGIWVSSVEASHFDTASAYVTFDGHRSADLTTWLFKTSDYGQSWTAITHNLPGNQPLYVVREDPKNPSLLFVGSEFALFVSIDSGQSWSRLMNNLPTVAVHDLVIHPRDGDLIAGTHGRGLWVLDDIAPLQQLSDDLLRAPAHLFANRPATLWEDASRGGVRGNFFFAAKNPPYIPHRENVVRAKLISGGLIHYYLKESIPGGVEIEITDIEGERKRTLPGPGEPGIHRVLWDFRFDPSPEQAKQFMDRVNRFVQRVSKISRLSPAQQEWLLQAKALLKDAPNAKALDQLLAEFRETFSGIVGLERGFPPRLRGDLVEPGQYLIHMSVAGETYTRIYTVRPDPILEGDD